MKLHKKFEHNIAGVGYWGERPGVSLRVNFGNFNANDNYPEDVLHYHNTRVTYFCVLEWQINVEVEGVLVAVTNEAMLEVAPLEKYRTLGVGEKGCKYIVIGSHNEEDRVNVI